MPTINPTRTALTLKLHIGNEEPAVNRLSYGMEFEDVNKY
jgi:hypothetical protein